MELLELASASKLGSIGLEKIAIQKTEDVMTWKQIHLESGTNENLIRWQ